MADIKNNNLESLVEKILLDTFKSSIKDMINGLITEIKKAEIKVFDSETENIPAELYPLWEEMLSVHLSSCIAGIISDDLRDRFYEILQQITSMIGDKDILVFISTPKFKRNATYYIEKGRKDNILKTLKAIAYLDESGLLNFFSRKNGYIMLSEFEYDLLLYKKNNTPEKLFDLLYVIENNESYDYLGKYLQKYGSPKEHVEIYILNTFFGNYWDIAFFKCKDKAVN